MRTGAATNYNAVAAAPSNRDVKLQHVRAQLIQIDPCNWRGKGGHHGCGQRVASRNLRAIAASAAGTVAGRIGAAVN